MVCPSYQPFNFPHLIRAHCLYACNYWIITTWIVHHSVSSKSYYSYVENNIVLSLKETRRRNGQQLSALSKPKSEKFQGTELRPLKKLSTTPSSPSWPAPTKKTWPRKCFTRRTAATWRRSAMSSWKTLSPWQPQPQLQQPLDQQDQPPWQQSLAEIIQAELVRKKSLKYLPWLNPPQLLHYFTFIIFYDFEVKRALLSFMSQGSPF